MSKMYKDDNTNDPIDDAMKEQISKTWGNYCPSCGHLKDKSSIKLFRKSGPVYQYISECPNCGLKTIISLIPNLGMQVTQLHTDISYQEMANFNSPITSNDYLEFYKEIKKVVSVKELLSLIHK